MASNLQQFNHTYAEFVGQLKATFPKMTKKLPNYSEYKDQDFLKDFVKYNLQFMDALSVGNTDIFIHKHKQAFLVANLPFRSVLKRSPPALIQAVLNYLRDLFDLGCKTKKMDRMASKLKDTFSIQRISVLQHHEAIMKNFRNEEPEDESISDDDSDNEDEGAQGLLESLMNGMGGGDAAGLASMMSGLNGANLPDPTALFGDLENSEIGRLAKELYDGMGEEEMQELSDIGRQGFQNPAALMGQLFGAVSGDGSSSGGNIIGNLVERTVGNIQQKMESGEIDMERMMTDVQGFLNVLDPSGNNMPMPPGFAEAAAQTQEEEGAAEDEPLD